MVKIENLISNQKGYEERIMVIVLDWIMMNEKVKVCAYIGERNVEWYFQEGEGHEANGA